MNRRKDWSAASNNELAAAFHRGDETAGHILAERWLPYLYGYFSARIYAPWIADADDLTSETWEQALRSLRKRVPWSFDPWMWKIARTRLATYIKNKQKDPAVRAGLHPIPLDPPDAASSHGFRLAEMRRDFAPFYQDVLGAIDSMPAEYRSVLRAFLETGATGKDLAVTAGISAREATRRLSDGRPILYDTVAVLAMARGIVRPCRRFRQLLTEAGWRGGPLGADLRETLSNHIGQCRSGCKQRREDLKVKRWQELMPVFIPALVPAALYAKYTGSRQRQTRQPPVPPSVPPSPKKDQDHKKSGAAITPFIIFALLASQTDAGKHLIDEIGEAIRTVRGTVTLGVWTNMSVQIQPAGPTCRGQISCRQQYPVGTVVSLRGIRTQRGQSFRWVGCGLQAGGQFCTVKLSQNTAICLVDGQYDQGVLTEADCRGFTGIRP